MSSPLLLSTELFDRTAAPAVRDDTDAMSMRGTARAIAALVVIMMVTGGVGWFVTDVGRPGDAPPPPFAIGAAVCALGLAIWASLRPRLSPTLAPAYAAAQGLVLGSISHRYHAVSDGVVLQAIAGTVAALAAVTLLHRFGLHVSNRFGARVIDAAVGLLLFWLVTLSLRAGGIEPAFLASRGAAVLVSLVSVVVAVCFLVLDFEVIAEGVRSRASREFEWYAALSVVITLVWIYIELLALAGEGDGDVD